MNDFKQAAAVPRKIAVYASLSLKDYFMVSEVRYASFDEHYQPLALGQVREIALQGYVRISNVIEVAFDAISDEAMVGNAVATLNDEERRLIADFDKQLVHLRDRRSQLLALTHSAFPQCSVCRREHGPEVTHAAE